MKSKYSFHDSKKIRFNRETKKLPVLRICKCGEASSEYVDTSVGWRVVCMACGKRTRLCPNRTKAAELWNKGDVVDV